MAVKTPIKSRTFQTVFDHGRHNRAHLGFVVLADEHTVESDCFRLAPDGVGVFFARQPVGAGNDAVTELASLEAGIESASSMLLPSGDLDVACYTCNCATTIIGERNIVSAMRRGRQSTASTTVMTNVVRGLRALGARRIVVGTPYQDTVNNHVLSFLQNSGFEVLDLQGLNLTTDDEMRRVDPAFLKQFGARLDQDDADAVFLCCGAIRTLDIVDELERDIGKPVVVSNQAMMWDCLRLAGVDDPIEGFGKLMTLPFYDSA